MDEISQGPEREPRLSSKRRRGLAAAGVAGLVAVAVVLAVTRGGQQHGAAAPPAPTPTPTPTPSASGAMATTGPQAVVAPPTMRLALPGSELIAVPNGQEIVAEGASASVLGPPVGIFTCQTAIWGQLGAGWHAGSLRVGSLWLVAGTRQGYVRVGRAEPARDAAPGHTASSRNVDMLLHLDAGSTVVMRVAAGSQRYFRFLGNAGAPLASDRALIFTSCPGSDSEGSGGFTDFFEVPFSIAPGHPASVEVWTSASARPVWLTFSAPRPGVRLAPIPVR